MWMKDVTRRILVNMAHVAQVDMAEMSNGKWGVKSWEVGERGADYLLFSGTEAECVDYLGELEEVLAEQGDRVAVALEKIAKQGEKAELACSKHDFVSFAKGGTWEEPPYQMWKCKNCGLETDEPEVYEHAEYMEYLREQGF